MKRFISFVVVMFSFITSAMANLEVRTLEKEKFSIVAINDEVSERKDWRKDVDINFDSYDKMYK